MDIDHLRNMIKQQEYVFTQHALRRMSKEKITIDQVEEAILTGEIILERPKEKPYPKCLISGYAKKEFLGKKKEKITNGERKTQMWLLRRRVGR